MLFGFWENVWRETRTGLDVDAGQNRQYPHTSPVGGIALGTYSPQTIVVVEPTMPRMSFTL